MKEVKESMSSRGRRGGGRGGSKGHWGGGGHRSRGGGAPQPNVHSDNPVIQQFQKFAVSLDQRHDKRERLVKLSRDVTIEAKRIIFLLHRYTDVSVQFFDTLSLFTSLAAVARFYF